jgi:Cu+-exporting ATPase
MDTLVSAGALASYLLSSLQMLRHTLHLYFDTASMLVTFVLFGAYLERRARDRISAGIAGLYRMAQGKIRIVEGGREKWVDAEMARPKDRFMVLSGETIPLDSRVVGGSGLVDESLLTGEARPRPKGPGDPVIGGSTVRDGQMTLEAVHTADGSTVRQIIDRVEEALSGKDTHELLADRISRLFIPVVFAVAGATALACGLSDASLDEALLRCLTVVLISCPCALGIAIPLVKVAVIGLARKKGVHVRESGALERMKDLDTIVFDKTGTLTEGTYALEAVIGGGLDDRTILSRLAAIEVASPHFLAREIVREAARRGGRPLQAQAVEAVPGLGVKGRVEGVETCLGNRRFMEGCGFFLPDAMDREAASWEKRGRTTAFFAWERSVRGFLIFGDPVRPGANEAVRLLCERGIDVWLISGDARTTTEAVAESLGITRFAGQALPAEKVDHIRRLQDEGRRVGMVGDGLNDAAALAQADVGCAFGPASGTLRNASDITFLSPDPRKLLDAIALSALATRTMRQNLFFAFSYNAVAIPVAALGLLNPLIAVLAMFASSLVVTANALRISSADPS